MLLSTRLQMYTGSILSIKTACKKWFGAKASESFMSHNQKCEMLLLYVFNDFVSHLLPTNEYV